MADNDLDRKLRPIFEALNYKNYKQAIKVASSIEVKKPEWPAPKVLRAVALQRLGRIQEALAIIQKLETDILVNKSINVDEDLPFKFQIFYRDANMDIESAKIFEHAWSLFPHNARLAEAVAFIYFRNAEYTEAQKIATRIQKKFPSNPMYAFWPLTALYMSMITSSSDPRLSGLAPALTKKIMSSNLVSTPDQARFCTDVLLKSGEYDFLRDSLDENGLIGKAIKVDGERWEARAKLEYAAGNFIQLKITYEHFLKEIDPDNWKFWKNYIDLCLSNTEFSSAARSFVEELKSLEFEKRKGKNRGPFLANIYYESKVKNYEAMTNLLVDFYSMFSDSMVCCHDMRPYLSLVPDKVSFCQSLLDRMKEDRDRSLINYLWITLWYKVNSNYNVHDLFTKYKSTLDPSLESVERQSGDDLIILAVHYLLPNRESMNAQGVFNAIILLEAALCYSPYNFHFRLLLIHLYVFIGCASKAYFLWKTLSVKHIQLVTIGQYIYSPLLSHCNWNEFKVVCSEIRDFENECVRDGADGLAKAFSSHAYSTACEFIEFQQKLNRAEIFLRSKIDRQYMNIACNFSTLVNSSFENVSSLVEPTNIMLYKQVGSLFDTKDKKVMGFWQETACDADEIDQTKPKAVSNRDRVYLQLRVLILQCVLSICAGRQDQACVFYEQLVSVIMENKEHEYDSQQVVLLSLVKDSVETLVGKETAQLNIFEEMSTISLFETELRTVIDSAQKYQGYFNDMDVVLQHHSISSVATFTTDVLCVTTMMILSITKKSKKAKGKKVKMEEWTNLSNACKVAHEKLTNVIETIKELNFRPLIDEGIKKFPEFFEEALPVFDYDGEGVFGKYTKEQFAESLQNDLEGNIKYTVQNILDILKELNDKHFK